MFKVAPERWYGKGTDSTPERAPQQAKILQEMAPGTCPRGWVMLPSLVPARVHILHLVSALYRSLSIAQSGHYLAVVLSISQLIVILLRETECPPSFVLLQPGCNPIGPTCRRVFALAATFQACEPMYEPSTI